MKDTDPTPISKKRVFLQFLWILLVARVITGLTISQDLFDGSAWLIPKNWIAPLGFAIIWTVIYWKNQRDK